MHARTHARTHLEFVRALPPGVEAVVVHNMCGEGAFISRHPLHGHLHKGIDELPVVISVGLGQVVPADDAQSQAQHRRRVCRQVKVTAVVVEHERGLGNVATAAVALELACLQHHGMSVEYRPAETRQRKGTKPSETSDTREQKMTPNAEGAACTHARVRTYLG